MSIEENKDLLSKHAEMVNAYFENILPARSGNTVLIKSMRYSLLASGKRIRPHLTMEFCKLFGENEEIALPYGCAVEAIHTYSLIHDDLPCMDDDDIRRGKPTNHRVYGEAIALLAGDALQSLAFSLIASNNKVRSEVNARAVAFLAEKIGYAGMVGGQEEDIANENKFVTAEDLSRINKKKTGALLEAACGLGCIAAGADEKEFSDAICYAENFGAAFQIIDDILDITVSTRDLGKSALSDVKNEKKTYATMLGKDGAYRLAEVLIEKAVVAVEKYPGSAHLVQFARDSLVRKK